MDGFFYDLYRWITDHLPYPVFIDRLPRKWMQVVAKILCGVIVVFVLLLVTIGIFTILYLILPDWLADIIAGT